MCGAGTVAPPGADRESAGEGVLSPAAWPSELAQLEGHFCAARVGERNGKSSGFRAKQSWVQGLPLLPPRDLKVGSEPLFSQRRDGDRLAS